jgi:hypothetical protein
MLRRHGIVFSAFQKLEAAQDLVIDASPALVLDDDDE